MNLYLYKRYSVEMYVRIEKMKGFSVGLHQHGNRSHSPCTDHNQSDKSNFEILFYSFIL